MPWLWFVHNMYIKRRRRRGMLESNPCFAETAMQLPVCHTAHGWFARRLACRFPDKCIHRHTHLVVCSLFFGLVQSGIGITQRSLQRGASTCGC